MARPVFFSVAKLGGSVSLPIRLSETKMKGNPGKINETEVFFTLLVLPMGWPPSLSPRLRNASSSAGYDNLGRRSLCLGGKITRIAGIVRLTIHAGARR